MHVQVVTYRMTELNEADFVEANKEFAAMMAVVPGLLTKIWLRDPNENVYGGLYLWKDRAAFEAFRGSELWGEVVSDSSLLDLTSHDFMVMKELTQLTQPGITVV